jgi:predicted transcriptional regulator
MLNNSWDYYPNQQCSKTAGSRRSLGEGGTAKEIVEELMRQGVKQEVIAIEANINQSTVSRILTGKHKNVRLATRIKLVKVMSVVK